MRVGRGIECVLAPFDPGRLDLGNQTPEQSRSGRVRYQMNALGTRRVVHPMEPPVVEQPGLAGGHVHPFVAALERDIRVGLDRDMYSHSRKPVMVDVRVERDGCAWREAHQPGTTPHDTEACQ